MYVKMRNVFAHYRDEHIVTARACFERLHQFFGKFKNIRYRLVVRVLHPDDMFFGDYQEMSIRNRLYIQKSQKIAIFVNISARDFFFYYFTKNTITHYLVICKNCKR